MEFPNPVSKLVYLNLTMAKQGFYLELLQHTTTIKAESPVLIVQRRSDRGLVSPFGNLSQTKYSKEVITNTQAGVNQSEIRMEK